MREPVELVEADAQPTYEILTEGVTITPIPTMVKKKIRRRPLKRQNRQ